jgi:hypothetical protein
VGAYAVESIDYEVGTSSGKPAIAFTITYRRTRAEIFRIQKVLSVEEAGEVIGEALKNYQTGLVMEIQNYRETDFVQLVETFASENPNEVIEVPRVSVSLYPDSGAKRVVELSFAYQTSRDSLRVMQKQVKHIFESAKLYVSGSESDYQKLSRLYVFLTGGVDVDRMLSQNSGSSITPAYSLLRYGVGDSRAFADVYAAMCRQVGVECLTVSGTCNGEAWFWNIVKDGDQYAHVDLLRCAQAGYFRERSDEQMEGYVWDYLAYPACEWKNQTPTETTEETTQPDVTEGTETATVPPETEGTEPPAEG